MARRTTGKNRREKARGTGGAGNRRAARERAARRIREKALSENLSELLANGHAAAAELTGVPLLGISEDEVRSLAGSLAKVIAAKGKLPKVEARIAKHGPWTNFLLVLAAVYGPRLWMLWKMWEVERARQKRVVLRVVPAREDSDPALGADPDKAVN